MSVQISVIREVVVQPPPSAVTVTLDLADAIVLRTMLGGMKRDERRAATRANGGSQAQCDRARFLVKEIIDLLSAEGINPPSIVASEVTLTDDAEDEGPDLDYGEAQDDVENEDE